jgi:predicted nucleotidyltransferase
MAVSEAHRRHWMQRWAAEAEQRERRRAAALEQAEQTAAALRRQWPCLSAIWLFGSALTGSFAAHSDIDLAVEGLPAADLLVALALSEASGEIPVDLVRLEGLPPHWQQRIRQRGRRLT